MQTKGFLYSVCKVGDHGMVCHGQPFLALNDEAAQQMVKSVFKEFENSIDAYFYRLVCLCGYDLAADQPIEGLKETLKTYSLPFIIDDGLIERKGSFINALDDEELERMEKDEQE